MSQQKWLLLLKKGGQMGNVKLNLLNFNVGEISFKLNQSFKPANELIQVNPIISRQIEKIDADTVLVKMKLEIEDDLKKPFFGTIIIQGVFKCTEWENSDDGRFLVNETTSAILFPYLRQTLTQVTALLNVSPYILPIVNTIELFKHSK